MDISNVEDIELVDSYKAGDKNAAEKLIKKYDSVVKKLAASMYIMGGDESDLSQEGFMGLLKAAKYYDSGREASFRTFAKKCIMSSILTAIDAANSKRNEMLNGCVSLDAPASKNKDTDNYDTLADKIAAYDKITNPEEIVLSRENAEGLMEAIRNESSDFEYQVLELYIQGISYNAIAEMLGKSPRTIDNALQRVKNKIKNLKSMKELI